MGKFGRIILALIVLGLPAAVHSAAPQADCLGTLMKLSSCMKFVMLGSNDTTPESTCCDGLKNVLDTDANTGSQNGTQCLCDAFSNGGSSYGVQVNRTKSMSLADACSVTATNCSSSVPRSSSAPATAIVRAPPLDTPPALGNHSAGGIGASGTGTGSSLLAAFALIAAVVLFI